MNTVIITYDGLVDRILEAVLHKYGSIAEFTRHQDFIALGFTLGDSQKVQTYFAKPKKGQERRTKSTKTMSLLALEYLGLTVTCKTVVTKVQTLHIPTGDGG
jgi:hypothetical protein